VPPERAVEEDAVHEEGGGSAAALDVGDVTMIGVDGLLEGVEGGDVHGKVLSAIIPTVGMYLAC
jgi:hypothetical protein